MKKREERRGEKEEEKRNLPLDEWLGSVQDYTLPVWISRSTLYIGIVLHARWPAFTGMHIRGYIAHLVTHWQTRHRCGLWRERATHAALPLCFPTRASLPPFCSALLSRSRRSTRENGFRAMAVSQWKRSHGEVLNIIDIVQAHGFASLSLSLSFFLSLSLSLSVSLSLSLSLSLEIYNFSEVRARFFAGQTNAIDKYLRIIYCAVSVRCATKFERFEILFFFLLFSSVNRFLLRKFLNFSQFFFFFIVS